MKTILRAGAAALALYGGVAVAQTTETTTTQTTAPGGRHAEQHAHHAGG
jgi:hypothetical protein